jgi:hypothetical protein
MTAREKHRERQRDTQTERQRQRRESVTERENDRDIGERERGRERGCPPSASVPREQRRVCRDPVHCGVSTVTSPGPRAHVL